MSKPNETKALAVAVQDAPKTETKKRGDREQLVLQLPTALKDALGKAAAAQDVSMNILSMRAIASAVNFDLSTIPVRESKTRRKYASEEERKAAQKKAADERRDLIKQLLAEHKNKVKAQMQATKTDPS